MDILASNLARVRVSVPAMEPKFAILAAEILDMVFSRLDAEDIPDVRLVCRRFAYACVRYMPTICVVNCTKDSLRNLQHIAIHPLFSQHIRSLTLDCSVFWTLVPGKVNNKSGDYVASSHPRLFPWCSKYQAIWHEQREIKQSNLDFNVISKAILQLKNLKNVEICMGDFQQGGRLIRETYTSAIELFSFAYDRPVSCSVNQYLMLMQPIRDAGIKIEKLALRDVSYTIFYPQEEIVGGMEEIFKHLTCLYIRVQVHPDATIRAVSPMPGLSQTLAWGAMARFLDAATGLRSLSLASKDDHGTRMMVVDYAFSDSCTWQYLHTLSLDNLWITEEVLTGLATRHAKTLRSLTLHKVVIRGSWFTALPAIRDVISLEKAIVYGWLSNPAGEYPRREYWRLGVYPDREHDTPWGDDNKQYQLGLQVGAYLCKDPAVSHLPLAYSNMTR